ncbi:MAG: hypothetical protein UHI93_06075, partial [Acutalibacteraceae bacterium]|nr:hypothetical protein [Acutalibacteraceae bacterium]
MTQMNSIAHLVKSDIYLQKQYNLRFFILQPRFSWGDVRKAVSNNSLFASRSGLAGHFKSPKYFFGERG